MNSLKKEENIKCEYILSERLLNMLILVQLILKSFTSPLFYLL